MYKWYKDWFILTILGCFGCVIFFASLAFWHDATMRETYNVRQAAPNVECSEYSHGNHKYLIFTGIRCIDVVEVKE